MQGARRVHVSVSLALHLWVLDVVLLVRTDRRDQTSPKPTTEELRTTAPTFQPS